MKIKSFEREALFFHADEADARAYRETLLLVVWSGKLGQSHCRGQRDKTCLVTGPSQHNLTINSKQKKRESGERKRGMCFVVDVIALYSARMAREVIELRDCVIDDK